MKRSRAGMLIGGLVLAGGLLFARAAFSGKATDTAATAPINTGPSPMPAAGGCDTGASFELAQKMVGQVIEAKRWTAKDHERIAPLFYQLRTDQKIEILRRVGAALDARRMVVEKGARLF